MGARGGFFYRRSDGILEEWPRPAGRRIDYLLGVPIVRCFGCGVASVPTTRLCGWCGAVRHAVSQPVCARGHPLCGAGVYVARGGRRCCAECRRARERAKPRRHRRRLRVAA